MAWLKSFMFANGEDTSCDTLKNVVGNRLPRGWFDDIKTPLTVATGVSDKQTRHFAANCWVFVTVRVENRRRVLDLWRPTDVLTAGNQTQVWSAHKNVRILVINFHTAHAIVLNKAVIWPPFVPQHCVAQSSQPQPV